MKNFPQTKRGTLYLLGGGDEAYNSWSDQLFQKIVDLNNKGTIAILNDEDDQNWMSEYFSSLGMKKADTFLITSRKQAEDAAIYQELTKYDALFLEGGHQQHYYDYWKGTPVEQAIFHFYHSGKLIAGTSAGAMILSEVCFLSKNGRVHPDVLFHNPFLQSVTLEDDFLNIIPGTIIDTHFSERGRLVRLVPLMARSAIQKGKSVLGIGIDEETALIIDPNLIGEVYGNRTTTFLKPTEQSQVRFQFPKPPEYTHLEMHQLIPGMKFDLKTQRVCDAKPLTRQLINRIDDPAIQTQPAAVKTIDGLIYLKKTMIMPNLLVNRDDLPAKILTILSRVLKKSANLGILMDAECNILLTASKTLTVSGRRSAFFLDMLTAQKIIPPANTGERKLPFGWVGAVLHCLHDDFEIDLQNYAVRRKD